MAFHSYLARLGDHEKQREGFLAIGSFPDHLVHRRETDLHETRILQFLFTWLVWLSAACRMKRYLSHLVYLILLLNA